MIKINYPKNINEFEDDYKKVFNISSKSWDELTKDMDSSIREVLKTHKIESLDDLLVASFDVLLDIYNNFPEQKIEKDSLGKKIKSKYEKVFDYEKYQSDISKFFMEKSKELNLKTCYFCNIDFINTINFDVLDILKNGTEQELKELDGVGKEKAQRIIAYRENKSINSIEDILKIDGINDIKKIEVSKVKKNHFTLDHFLPKAECPLLALSLYNFVPSCYSCNSKFKKEKKLLQTYLSPTSKDFSVGEDIQFKAYYQKEVTKEDLILEMGYPKKVQNYVSTFKLVGRYEVHKNEVFTLIEKHEKYSETRIEEIANILKISPHQVKKDIFGEQLFKGDMQDKSFTKMKRDIAKNIGIKGVKE
jgi:hypothetical protein